MNVVAIVQARMGSTRLPGKVVCDLAGEPMLVRTVSRVLRAQTVNKVVIATSNLNEEDPIVRLCDQFGWPCFRGSINDVLDRYYMAAEEQQAEAIVRITSDCPLIDPAVIDAIVKTFLEKQPEVDYVANTLPPRTFPRGLDTEVMSFAALERAWREDNNPGWREHVTPYIYRSAQGFRIYSVTHPIDYSAMRWTVDMPEDLEFVRRIYDYFGHDRFSWGDVLLLLDEHPDWIDINRHVRQKVL